MKTSSWFQFDQHNSGGRFRVDDKVCHRLFIEANNKEEAIEKALSLGVYFDGVAEGSDCPCCGDRWCTPNEVKFPLQYDEKRTFRTPEECAQYLANNYGWTEPDARIFYKAGRVVAISCDKSGNN